MFTLLTHIISNNNVIVVIKFTCQSQICWLGEITE